MVPGSIGKPQKFLEPAGPCGPEHEAPVKGNADDSRAPVCEEGSAPRDRTQAHAARQIEVSWTLRSKGRRRQNGAAPRALVSALVS